MKKNGYNINCKKCGKERYVTPSLVKAGRGIYCSASCRSKNAVYAMLAVRGDHWKEQIRIAMVELFKDPRNHPRWKGDNVGYFGLHDWIEKVGGKPNGCEICGTTEKRVYHWANKSNTYKRIRSDWMRLCVPCHRKYDYAARKKIRELSTT